MVLVTKKVVQRASQLKKSSVVLIHMEHSSGGDTCGSVSGLVVACCYFLLTDESLRRPRVDLGQ